MKNILLIESSPRGAQAFSHQAARSVVDGLRALHPGVNVVVRDLAENPPPHVGPAFVGALRAQPEELTPKQIEALAYSDLLINEIMEAEVIVFAVPMHNFGVPSTLKAWIDHVVRAGRTFVYTHNGPKGLATGKRAILALATGGVYSSEQMKPLDFTEPYLRAILGMIGITDIDVVRVEGSANRAIGPEKALATAITQSKQIVAQLAA